MDKDLLALNANVATALSGITDFMSVNKRGPEKGLGYMNQKDRDVNGKFCILCDSPITERKGKKRYHQRYDCGNKAYYTLSQEERKSKPLIQFNKPAEEKPIQDKYFWHTADSKTTNANKKKTRPASTAFCELNIQKMCADALYNKDYLYQAKAINYPRPSKHDHYYCLYNGWLEDDVVKLQHSFDGMTAKAAAECISRGDIVNQLTLTNFSDTIAKSVLRGTPLYEEAKLLGSAACAMGSAGCDMAYCAYSFCKMPDGSLGSYEQCEGWDPVKGMPIPSTELD